jgi:signal transduction histidine kinase/ligand-binding sensor domain-containing protein
MNRKKTGIIFCFLMCAFCTYSQHFNKVNEYSINEGLPSNHLYDIEQDKDGFLWISSDNGISKFDGNYFYNYSIKDGLPSNDVLQVIVEKNGTLWVNCFNQCPAYFDQKSNRFVSLNSNKQVNEICKSFISFNILPNGIRFYGSKGSFEVIDKKTKNVSNHIITPALNINSESFQVVHFINQASLENNIKIVNNKRVLGTFSSGRKLLIISRIFEDNSIYDFFDTGEIIRYSNFKTKPFTFETKVLKLKEKFKWYKFSEKYLSIITSSGTIYIYDLKSLGLIYKVENSINTNSAFIDKNNNLWLGTLDNGLIKYRMSKIKKIETIDKSINTNFLSISKNFEGAILAGNFQGSIVEYKGRKIKNHSIEKNNQPMWIRKIICSQNNVFAINDLGCSVDFDESKKFFMNKKSYFQFKSATKFNDSIALFGSTIGIVKYNLKNQKYKWLNSPKSRIIDLKKYNDSVFYFISPEGLYRYNYKKQNYDSVNLKNSKPAIVTCDTEKVWISTFTGDLLCLKNDKIIKTIPNSAGLPENITSMIVVKNKLWIASKTGIYILDYKNDLSYKINKMSKSDGLSSNFVNEIFQDNDSIFAATSEGVSVIPSQINISKFEINICVNTIKINNKNIDLLEKYSLENNQKNIAIQFSGVELTGHFKYLQYTFEKNKNWTNIEGNTVNLQLKNGLNELSVRAIDANNNISNRQLKIDFTVDTPFYQTIWFWGILTSLLTGLGFRIYNQRKLAFQKGIFQQEIALEKQRNKITSDLHDDIGSTLSSLQINSAVANKLIHTNRDQAQFILEKIENQSKNLAEKIGDIIWSLKPGKDEFMTISTRIKNFVNDILGATGINYSINIDSEIDDLIQDFSARKNIVFIVKEAVNNAAKHSQATLILIEIKKKVNHLELIVNDNGIGIESNYIKGNGLSNIKNRVEELHGKYLLTTNKNQGTTIFAEIPIPNIRDVLK